MYLPVITSFLIPIFFLVMLKRTARFNQNLFGLC